MLNFSSSPTLTTGLSTKLPRGTTNRMRSLGTRPSQDVGPASPHGITHTKGSRNLTVLAHWDARLA